MCPPVLSERPEDWKRPIPAARWNPSLKLHWYQQRTIERAAQNRKGIVALDVGLGKTFTGLGIVARAREEGWGRRPVIVVKNSLLWNWYEEARKALPDYRVGVVGGRRVKATRAGGAHKKGDIIGRKDTPAEQLATLRRFQQGDLDLLIISEIDFRKIRVSAEYLQKYAAGQVAIRRERELAVRNVKAKKTKDKSARDEAVKEAQVRGWVARTMLPPKGQEYVKGIEFEELGIDLVLVDEMQIAKNLFMAQAQAGATVDFMGGSGEGSALAWQMDFRLAFVRRGGGAVFGLTATPAKNSARWSFTTSCTSSTTASGSATGSSTPRTSSGASSPPRAA
jgi:N12 class adenine-specific DNA methylase